MERDKANKSESVGQTLPWKQKKGILKFLDSFHQNSWNFVEISTVVWGSFWGVEIIQNGARCHGNQGAKNVKFTPNRMAANIKIKKIVKNSKMKTFQWKFIFIGSKTCCTILRPYWLAMAAILNPKWPPKYRNRRLWARFGFQVDYDVANWYPKLHRNVKHYE